MSPTRGPPRIALWCWRPLALVRSRPSGCDDCDRGQGAPLERGEGRQERRVLHPVGRHRARDERVPRVRPGRVPREGRPAPVRRPRVEQLREVLRAALHGLRSQEADLDVVRAGQQPGREFYQPTLFETYDPQFDATKTRVNGKKFVLERIDINDDGVDQHRRSPVGVPRRRRGLPQHEVTALRDQADFVITNPPFSLFRQFMTWVVGGERRFSVIANNNAITYNEVFPHIRANESVEGCHGQQHRHGVRQFRRARGERRRSGKG